MRSVRGCARLLASLTLIVVAPVWLGIAASVDATHTVLWPTWYVWVATLAGVGLWVRGWMLRGLARESVGKAIQEWDALEKRHLEVERAFLPLLVAGRYDRGLAARLEAARAERENLRARIAAAASIPFVASLSGATAREAEMIVEDVHGLMDAHVAMRAACDLFALTPTWRTVWENELGPVYEDLTVIETITETVQSRSMAPMVLSMAASLVLWLDEQRLAVNDLGTSLERAQIDSAEALTQLDRIADEARVHLVHLVEAALGADTSMIGQRRYKRWRKGAGEKLRTNETPLPRRIPDRRRDVHLQPRPGDPPDRKQRGYRPQGERGPFHRALHGVWRGALRASRVPPSLPRVGRNLAVRLLAGELPDVGRERRSARAHTLSAALRARL